jgi:hypothetical protein
MVAARDVRSARLPCEVGRGLFSNERSIRVTLPEGQHITALVHQRDVQVKQEPPDQGVVPGSVAVWVIAEEGPFAVVDLPQPGFEGGPRLRVPTAWLE